MITSEFEDIILRHVFRGETLASLGITSYYVGLCTIANPTRDSTLADLTEVSGTGYARKEVPVSISDWAEPAAHSNSKSITSDALTWTAGGTWTGFDRLFLASVVSGTVGKLLAISGALLTEKVLEVDQTYTATMDMYVR